MGQVEMAIEVDVDKAPDLAAALRNKHVNIEEAGQIDSFATASFIVAATSVAIHHPTYPNPPQPSRIFQLANLRL